MNTFWIVTAMSLWGHGCYAWVSTWRGCTCEGELGIADLMGFRNTWAIKRTQLWMFQWTGFQNYQLRRRAPPWMWWHHLLGWGLGLNKEEGSRKPAEHLAVPILCFLASTKDKQPATSLAPCQWGNVLLWTVSQNKALLDLPFYWAIFLAMATRNTTNTYRFWNIISI